MKIEIIWADYREKKIIHVSSSELKVIKLERKKEQWEQEKLAYIENYCTENGFKLFDYSDGRYRIIKE